MSESRIAMFENMASSDPENELAHFTLGKLYFDAGRYSDAESSLRRTLEINAQHTQAHRFLGETLLKSGKAEEAHAILLDGVRLGHVRGEYMPRNQMIEILEREGVELPKLIEDDDEDDLEGEGEGDSDTFTCRRCLKPGVALDSPPFSSDVGRQIHESICQDCWKEWMTMSVKVINEMRLNPATPEGSRAYDQHMSEFLGLSGAS